LRENKIEPEISFVIPCYNEARRLEPGFSSAMKFLLSRLGENFEVILVNDGSTDNTSEVLREVKRRNSSIPIDIIEYGINRGKGFAVKTGVLSSRGQKIVQSDADFSIDLEEAIKFLSYLDEYDIVIGTKKHQETESLRHQSLARRFLGKGFTLLTNFWLGINFSDITCGLKAFRREAALDIFSRQRLERWSYDAEILYLAVRRNYKILERPVRWQHVEGSKVMPLLDIVRSFKELMAIRFYHRL
jgi:dolichyl-phosphate beta-glucosyltransferase